MRARKGEAKQWLQDAATFVGESCLRWPFGKTAKGYGSARLGGKTIHAHRAVCLIAHGPAPAGHTDAAHECGDRLCCNPAHLRHATSAGNHADMVRHGTSLAGERNPHAKLSSAQVVDLRSAANDGVEQAELARRYGVTGAAVSSVVNRVTWRG